MSAVRYRLHLVPGDLTDRVAAVWTLDTDAATPWTEHAWPTLHTDVVLVGGPSYVRACVSEALPVAAHWLDVGTLHPREYRHGPSNRLTGVRLRPGVGGVLGAAGGAGPLADRVRLADEAIWWHPDPARRAAAAIAWLRRADLRPPSAALWAALASHDRVDDAARALGVTPRTLHRRTLDVAGVGPKQVLRLRRFRRAAQLLDRLHAHEGFSPIYDLGYADQAHFVRECRALTGHPPGAWWGPASDSFNRG
ncbi:MAG: AraC family transcriptional regulator [Myxococcales bacterium]|nr:AraC family transcriptional regulator [Myxococcales bacterium]